jgi:hypothetical protein
MTEVKKVDQEDLNKIFLIQQRFFEITKLYGELHFQKKAIEKEQFALENKMSTIEEDKHKLLEELQTKYGTGSINIETGEFLPEESK